jgi:hypothetical protein
MVSFSQMELPISIQFPAFACGRANVAQIKVANPLRIGLWDNIPYSIDNLIGFGEHSDYAQIQGFGMTY